jgi:subtilisin family serine protease
MSFYRLDFTLEALESRYLLNAAFDITSLTALRADANFAGIDGSGIGIAVIDTGAYDQHPDLRNNFAAFFNAVTGSPTSAADTNIADSFDVEGHGTHVSGIAASSNPDIGVATSARLIDIHAFPTSTEKTPTFDPIDNGLQWVINHYAQFNIKVVNLSLGIPSVNDNTGTITDQEEVDIRDLESLGITVVAASGNNYASFAPQPGAETPAAYSTLSVANTWATPGSLGEFPLITGSSGAVTYFAEEDDATPDRFSATSQRSTLTNQIAAPGIREQAWPRRSSAASSR